MIGEQWKPKMEEEDIGWFSAPAINIHVPRLLTPDEKVTKQILQELAMEAADNNDEEMFEEYSRRFKQFD